MEIIKKAYRVWVHSHIGEYPIFKIDDIEPVYAKNPGEAKAFCDFYGHKNSEGEDAQWTDIKCKRAKEYDKIKYNGQEIKRFELSEIQRIERRVKELNNLPDNEMFYVQDARSYSGNSIFWWGLNSSGYVINIDKAQKYTKKEILEEFANARDTDIIWLASHVENNIRKHVDIQYLERNYSY